MELKTKEQRLEKNPYKNKNGKFIIRLTEQNIHIHHKYFVLPIKRFINLRFLFCILDFGRLGVQSLPDF